MKIIISVLFIGLFVNFSACTGSDSESDNDSENREIDISQYLFPESSRTQFFDFYACIGDCEKSPNQESVTWVVDGNNISYSAGADSESYLINETTITETFFNGLDDTTKEFPRFVMENDNIATGDSVVELVKGPFATRTFTSGPVTLTENDVLIILTSELDNNIVSLAYYTKVKGYLGYVYFEGCEENIELSLETDFVELCDKIETEVLVEVTFPG